MKPTTQQLNERQYVRISWKPETGTMFTLQPGIFHTIQEALVEITKISHFNTTGTYNIITPYEKYEVTDLFQMKCKKI